ncbi:MAG: hypothetical protein JWM57_1263 [Phycisphaerales bacterium]|nr:hypothetical protein [Phycisphaerales bacterium]
MSEHEEREYGVVHAGQDFGQAFVIVGEAAEPGRPRVRPLDDPTLGQEHKSLACLLHADHHQFHPVRFGGSGHGVAGVGLVGIERRHVVAAYFLHAFCRGRLTNRCFR